MIEPQASLSVNGVGLTLHQLEVIYAIFREGSQRAAAASLGISTPVLNRYLGQIERKIGEKLTATSPTGTVLNDHGERIAREFAALKTRLARAPSIVVGGTIVTEELLLASLSKVDPEGRIDLIISDDERNLKDFHAGMMDMVVLDDPLYAFDEADARFEEIGYDRLIHVDKGPNYAMYRYGAQRIGFTHLRAIGKEFKVERSERSLTSMMRSDLSFFVNESLAARKGLKLRSATDLALLRHEIIALYREEGPEVMALMQELRRERSG